MSREVHQFNVRDCDEQRHSLIAINIYVHIKFDHIKWYDFAFVKEKIDGLVCNT